jgi:(5-formylfuran-3-yl)methyl phosphate synthase
MEMIASRTAMLASVSSVAEARLVVEHGADIVDLKDPARGALGALEVSIVRDIVADLDGKVIISATVGDLPTMQPEEVKAAVKRTAQTGVDIVKVGFFSASTAAACIAVLAEEMREGVKLVAVLFADQQPQRAWLPRFAEQGWYGVMLDTARKDGLSLRNHLSDEELGDFVRAARRFGLAVGLAGSLRGSDIPHLLPFHSDYLGFRGALCGGGTRTANIDAAAVMRIRAAIPLSRYVEGFSAV